MQRSTAVPDGWSKVLFSVKRSTGVRATAIEVEMEVEVEVEVQLKTEVVVSLLERDASLTLHYGLSTSASGTLCPALVLALASLHIKDPLD